MNRRRAMEVLSRLDPAEDARGPESQDARALMESIVRSEEGARTPGPPRRVPPRLATALAVALLLVPAGIGLWLAFGGSLSDPDPRQSAGQAPPASQDSSGPPPQTSAGADEPRYQANAMVLQWQGQPARLCLGSILESLPPQCGDVPIPNWDWDAVEGEDRMSGTRWGEFHVVGTYDGETFTVVEAGPPRRQPNDPSDDIVSACPEPEGGWSAPDPSRVSDEDLQAASRYANAQQGFSGLWVTYIEYPVTEENAGPSNIVLNTAFTGDIEAHRAALADIWGGPLCVVQFERAESELRRIQKELTDHGQEEFGFVLLSASSNVFLNRVELGVIVADEELQQAIDDRYGVGVVELHPALEPVE